MTRSESGRVQCHVGIGRSSDSLVPAEVTAIVGVTPTAQHAKGELRAGKRGPAPWGVWQIKVRGDDVTVAMGDLLALAGGREANTVQAATKFSAVITAPIGWEPRGGDGGYAVPAGLVHELSRFASRVDFYGSSAWVDEDSDPSAA